MEKQRTTAGETAIIYPKRVRIFDPKGRASRDIVTYVSDIYVERFVRAFARRTGRRISVRMVKEGGAV